MNWKTFLEWILIIFVLYLIFELLRRLFGGSLGFEELAIGLLLANIGYSFHIHAKLARLQARLAEHLGWHKGRKETN